jgi:hypothetical protein
MVSMTIITGDTRTETNGNITTMTSISETTTLSLSLETGMGPIPEVSGPFKVTGGEVSMSSNQTSVTTNRSTHDVGACRYPVSVGTVEDIRTASSFVLDDMPYVGQLTVDSINGFYALVFGPPNVNVTMTSVITQVSQGGGMACPDTGPPTSTTMIMAEDDIRSSQLTYMGTFDPAMPNTITGEEMITGDTYPRFTRMTRWSFTKF